MEDLRTESDAELFKQVNRVKRRKNKSAAEKVYRGIGLSTVMLPERRRRMRMYS